MIDVSLEFLVRFLILFNPSCSPHLLYFTTTPWLQRGSTIRLTIRLASPSPSSGDRNQHNGKNQLSPVLVGIFTSFLRIGRASRMMLRCIILNIVKLLVVVQGGYHLSRWLNLHPPSSLFSDLLSPSPDDIDPPHPIILRDFDYDNDAAGTYCYN